jgi:hypothetical protein
MVLNNITSTIYIDSSFFFTDSFPISNVPTPFTMNITYRYVNPTTNILQDTVVAIHFYVEQTSQTTLPAGVDEICQSSTTPPPVQAVIKSVCFVPSPSADTLHVVYSEPLAGLNPPVNPYTDFLLYTSNGSYPFATANPWDTTTGNMLVYAFPKGTLSNLDSIVEGTSPAFHLTTCGNVSIVVKSIATVNPFMPGKSIIPPSQRNPNGGPTTGTRIEVTLIPAIIGDLQNGKATGTVTIFDAVGNVVINRIQMFPDITAVSSPKLFWVWDGKTRVGSWAAPGTYLARITISDPAQNTTQNTRLNIGIKH